MSIDIDEDNSELLAHVFDETQCNDENEIHDGPVKFTDEITVKRIYLLGRIIATTFNEANLPYWVTGGTALGIERHKGLIPWDDDLDICVQDIHEEKLKGLQPTLLSHGIQLHEAFSGYRLFHTHESIAVEQPGQKFKRHYPFCDVFIMRHNKKTNRFELRNNESRICWEDEWYNVDDVEPRKLRLFGNFYLMCANDQMPYLINTYGPKCMVIGSTLYYSHSDPNIYLKNHLIPLETVGYAPAQPFE